MANLVEITITVQNQQAVGAVKQTISAFDQMPAAIAANTAALQQLTAQMNAAAAAMTRTGNAARTMGGHVTTSLDGVRLLSQEFGLRLPRALESMISRIPGVTQAIQGMVGALAGVAIAEVFVRAAAAVYNLYEKYVSLNAIAEQYAKTVQQHKDEDFINPRSIEEVTARIKEATSAAEEFKHMGASVAAGGWADLFLGGFTDPTRFGQAVNEILGGHDIVAMSYKSRSQADALTPKQLSIQHELNTLQIERSHAADGELQGQAKINAELQKRLELNRENRRYTAAQGSTVQGSGLRNDGKTKEDILDATARAEAAAQDVELQRQITNKTIQLQNEANNARLQGGALYLAQELQAEAAIRRSGVGTQAEIDAVRSRYHNEQMKRIEEETEAVAKRARAEQESGLTGIAKIQAQGLDRIGDINDRERKGLYADQAAPGQTSSLATQDRATANAQMYREMADAQKKFDQDQQAETDRANAAMLTGFARIDHELQESTQRRADAFEAMYGQMDHQSAIYEEAQRQLLARTNDDTANAARERLQLEQQIHDQTLDKDKEAAAAESRIRGDGADAWLAKYRETVASIQAAHTAMIAKIQAEENKPGVTQNAYADYERQKVDADRMANAQIADANQQLAHSIAGTLEQAFDNPVKFIQNRMKQMFFEMIANWITQMNGFKSVFGNQMGSLQPATSHTGIGGLAQMVGLGSSPGTVAQSMALSHNGLGGFGGGGSTSAMGSAGVSFAGGGSTTAGMSAIAPSSANPAGAFSTVGSLANTGISGASALAALGGGSPSYSAPGFADNGEGGGFAGYLTGDENSVPPGFGANATDDVNSQAAQQAAQLSGGAAGASGAAGTASAALGVVGAGVGAYEGFMGVEGAFESGKASGILNGAASGAEMGAAAGMLAGPAGAAIGGIIGAAAGATAGLVGWATGEGGRIGGEKYFKANMEKQLQQIVQGYMRGGGGTASQAISALETASQSGLDVIRQKFGGDAEDWTRTHYVDKERTFLEQEINKLAGGGHDYLTAAAVQFHTGGTITGFGDLATSGDEGYIHAMLGEKIVNTPAALSHGPMIDAMNAGASQSDVAAMYLRTSSSGVSSGDTHNHYYGDANISALDSSDFENYLTNRGGMAAIGRATTKANSRYAGDADYGS